ncbi:MAG: hypothetical protein EA398_15890 [Deltaproteobacteria bacterium]|nr:MAG: hypothetical protein EA398_15890 [Deltaproteobacteria bacterium]
MSLHHPHRIDGLHFRDGTAVALITHFEPWSELDDPAQALREKLATLDGHLRTVRVRIRLHLVPVELVLECAEPAPDAVRRLCRDRGIALREPPPAGEEGST